MKISPTMGSLFDGSGGFPLGGLLHGIEPVWASEVEPYPIAVTKLHFPNMKHLGDVSKIHGREIAPVDVVTFGSPCQDMSIAGKRAGLLHTAKGDDTTTRSGLFYEAIRIMKEMREATHGKYPSFAVWENVPGALTSANGEDFRCVLQELLQIAEGGELSIPRPANGKWLHAGEILADHCSIAWRILDAQYWGVPQRRKRIYLVADFGGQRAGEILFERESMRGDSAEGREARQGTADDAERGVGGSDRVKCLTPWGCQSKRQYMINGAYTTLNAGNAQGGQAHGICYALDAMSSNSMKSNNPHSGFHEENVVKTLQAIGVDPTCNQGGNVIVQSYQKVVGALCMDAYKGPNRQYIGQDKLVVYDCRENGDGCTVPNLTGDHENRVTDYTAICVGNGQLHQTDLGDKTGALNCMHDQQAIIHKAKPTRKYIVRRLTPLECNRLQGFPDSWGFIPHKDVMTDEEYQFWTNVRNTHISINGRTPKSFTKKAMLDWYNKLHTDSAEYKMWGNGVAEPCVCFVMDGIAHTMAEQWAEPCNIGKE